jgi:hypothetical protein
MSVSLSIVHVGGSLSLEEGQAEPHTFAAAGRYVEEPASPWVSQLGPPAPSTGPSFHCSE